MTMDQVHRDTLRSWLADPDSVTPETVRAAALALAQQTRRDAATADTAGYALSVDSITAESAAAARGAALLDRVKPGWASLVDISRLDMRSGFWCVGGQAFNADRLPVSESVGARWQAVWSGYWALFHSHLNSDGRKAVHHGFTATHNDVPSDLFLDWDVLQAAWLVEIRTRLT